MGTVRTALAGIVTGALVVAGGATEAVAGTGSASGSGWSATVSVPDLTWTQHGCQDVPVQIATFGAIDGRWAVDLNARLQGSGSTAGWLFEYSYDSTYGSDAFQLCSWDPSGTYDVFGTIEIGHDGLTAPIATTFTISPMPGGIEISDVTTDSYGLTTVTGRATASSATLGVIGADPSGRISLERMSGGSWEEFDFTYPDQLGNFSTTTFASLSRGTQVRATYQGSNTTAPATSAVLTAGGSSPVATVRVKATGGRSKLAVDVGPNKGKGYWTFQLQVLRADGSWKARASYRTRGAKETRTLNLPRGTYRVAVRGKYGYEGVTSGAVTLKR